MADEKTETQGQPSGGALAPQSAVGAAAPPPTLGGHFAYEAVSQAASIVVQDATTYLRQVNAVSMTAISYCMAKLVQEKDPAYADLMQKINKNLNDTTQTFQSMGQAAAAVLAQFAPK